jgi:hypothetical protein
LQRSYAKAVVISISSNNFALRSALLRAYRRAATGKIVPASILRDAVLRTAPLDEVRGVYIPPRGFVLSSS